MAASPRPSPSPQGPQSTALCLWLLLLLDWLQPAQALSTGAVAVGAALGCTATVLVLAAVLAVVCWARRRRVDDLRERIELLTVATRVEVKGLAEGDSPAAVNLDSPSEQAVKAAERLLFATELLSLYVEQEQYSLERVFGRVFCGCVGTTNESSPLMDLVRFVWPRPSHAFLSAAVLLHLHVRHKPTDTLSVNQPICLCIRPYVYFCI